MGSAQVQGIPKGHSKKQQALCIVHISRILKISSHQEMPERHLGFKNFSAKHTSFALE